MTKTELLKTITDEETKNFVSKSFDLYERAKTRGYTLFSDFSNPYNTNLVYSYFKSDPFVNVMLFGGYDLSERNVIAFSSFDIKKEDFPISTISMKYNPKFSRKLNHRDFLGSVMNLGIKREKTGDILVYDDFAVMYVLDEISDYILNNLDFAAHTKLNLSLESKNFEPVINLQSQVYTVSSLRLDNIISTSFNLSRKQANELIVSNKVFVNFLLKTNVSFIVKDDDIISVRGFGRIKFVKSTAVTKKGKLVIEILRYTI